MKELLDAINAARIEHDGDRIATWCLGNVEAKEDVRGNVFPRKPSSDRKIDAAVALIMAVGLAQAASIAPGPAFDPETLGIF